MHGLTCNCIRSALVQLLSDQLNPGNTTKTFWRDNNGIKTYLNMLLTPGAICRLVQWRYWYQKQSFLWCSSGAKKVATPFLKMAENCNWNITCDSLFGAFSLGCTGPRLIWNKATDWSTGSQVRCLMPHGKNIIAIQEFVRVVPYWCLLPLGA